MGMARFSETVTGEARDGVLVATIDNPAVNALSAEVRAGLMAALDHAETHDDIAGVVITGAGRIFIGGADIREFGKPPVEPHLPAILDRIEAFAKPVVAAQADARVDHADLTALLYFQGYRQEEFVQ